MNRAKYLSPLFDFSRRRENDGGGEEERRALKYNVMEEMSRRGTPTNLSYGGS